MDSWLQTLWLLPLLGGMLLALMAAPLGCFMVWKRVSFFSDTLAHAMLLGVALHFLIHIPLTLSLLVTAGFFSCLLALIYRQTQYSADGFLVLLSQGGLALSILLMHLAGLSSVELMTYLIGDILLLQVHEVGLLAGSAVAMASLLYWQWPALISVTAHADLAAIEGVPVRRIHILLFGMMGVFMALCLPLTGALLLAAFLIAPPLAARRFAKTPEGMVLIAIVISIGCVSAGIAGSFVLNVPTGPFVALCFLVSWGLSQVIKPHF